MGGRLEGGRPRHAVGQGRSQHETGNRARGGVALSFVGVSGKEQRQAVFNLMDEFGEEWVAAWLRSRGLKDWGDFYAEGQRVAFGRIAS